MRQPGFAVTSHCAPVAHVRLHCVLGHRFFGPADRLLRRLRTA
jgi:hypothetical protein